MKLTHLSVLDHNIPAFAYLICENEGKLYNPVLDENRILSDFVEVECKSSLIPVELEKQIELKKGDRGLFAYHSAGEILIAEADELVSRLLELSKRQNLSDYYLSSFQTFAKKYGVFMVYLKEYFKRYRDFDSMAKLLVHVATDDTCTTYQQWAIKTWLKLKEQGTVPSDKILVNISPDGRIRTRFKPETKVIRWTGISALAIMKETSGSNNYESYGSPANNYF